MKFGIGVKDNHMEGTMSQISYLGLSFYLISKTGKFWSFFETSISRLHETKHKS